MRGIHTPAAALPWNGCVSHVVEGEDGRPRRTAALTNQSKIRTCEIAEQGQAKGRDNAKKRPWQARDEVVQQHGTVALPDRNDSFQVNCSHGVHGTKQFRDKSHVIIAR